MPIQIELLQVKLLLQLLLPSWHGRRECWCHVFSTSGESCSSSDSPGSSVRPASSRVSSSWPSPTLSPSSPRSPCQQCAPMVRSQEEESTTWSPGECQTSSHSHDLCSRSLGPEFGGAIGLMFTLANSIAVAMYVIGFCESLLDMLNEVHAGDFPGIVDNGMNDVRIIGCATVFLLLIIAVVGMEWITRVQTVLLVLLIFSQVF